MGSLRGVLGVMVGAVFLCGLYSWLDIKYGEKGFMCWSAFGLLTIALGGGTARGIVAAALLSGGKMGELEPFAVLLVSLLAAKVLSSRMPSQEADDVQVKWKPCEEQIRELLFQHDPSRLHLVDAELHAYKGRERQLLRKYKKEFAPTPTATSRRTSGGSGGRGGGKGALRPELKPRPQRVRSVVEQAQEEEARRMQAKQRVRSVVEQAQDEEARRVQANLEASLARIMSRKAGRR